MIINSYSDLYKEDSSLRPYQQKAKKEIFESWDEVDNVMFQMPTGTGKTRLFTSIISDINEYSKQRKEAVKILIVAHRTELIDQIHESLTKYRVPHNTIVGGREKNYKFPVNIASIQTITHPNNLKDAKKLNVQFIIIDEAHHALAASYKKLWKMYPNAKRLGVTATPWRMNHQSFLDLFNQLVLSMPIKDFIKQGYLAPYKYFSLRSDSDIQKRIDDIELDRFGEYKESSMEEKMDIGSIRAQLLDSYLSLAEGKKGIIYAINIVHAKHICKEYEKAGYKAVSIDSKTPAAERKELVDKFKKGKIDIIVNVDIFSEGFDCPDIEFIQLARPTRSLVKYLQQVGRGLRPTENKQNCVILDNVGMYTRFGLPDARRHWKYHFMGKDVVEEPKRGIGKGSGGQRYVDLSEGTEDMELIQDVYDEVELMRGSSSSISRFFPLWGFTLGKTTWKQAEEMGNVINIWKEGPTAYTKARKVTFWDHKGEGVFTSLYWTREDCDFPSSWKSNGFSWNLSYNEWINVFSKLEFDISITRQPSKRMCSGRNTLSAEFEALSREGTLLFRLDFEYGEKGCYTTSPKTLFSITVNYKGILTDGQDGRTEDTKLIQDKNNNDETNIVDPQMESDKADVFDPMPLLAENNYQDDNFIFWFKESKKIYEAYIQDDTYFIISELILDTTEHCIHRNRVGKISMESWMFWQMNREKVDNLKSIVHYGANYTVFHYRVLQSDQTIKDKYFDYKGREVDTPTVVETKYEKAKREGQLNDYIDVPVSKATFTSDLRSNHITINRTLKGKTSPIAVFSFNSDFGKNYHAKTGVIKNGGIEMGKAIIYTLPESFLIYRSDNKSFTVRCKENEIEYLYKYDLKGKLINKGTIALVEDTKTSVLSDSDINMFRHVFDSKATSYKYFWLLSILQIYKDSKKDTIFFKDILVKIVSIAWKYVFLKQAHFPSIDQLPNYLKTIQVKVCLDRYTKEHTIEEMTLEYYNTLKLGPVLSPLLKNVPYRFLSPWIPFTSNEDVIAKSNKKDARCLYRLQDDHITINPIWSDYLIENYDKIKASIEYELRSYLKC